MHTHGGGLQFPGEVDQEDEVRFSIHCGANQAGLEKQAEITAVTGRSVVVSDPALAGLPAGWFAEGWVEAGTGLNP